MDKKWLDRLMQWWITLMFVLGFVLCLKDKEYSLAVLLAVFAVVAWLLFEDAIKNT